MNIRLRKMEFPPRSARRPASLVVLALAWAVLAAPAAAQSQEGFKLPNLNPFRKASSSTPDLAPNGFPAATEPPPSNWAFQLPKLPAPNLPKPTLPKLPNLTMPKLPPLAPNGERNPGPSTWQKLSRGTKDFFSKTKSTLMPWADNKAPVRTAQAPRTVKQPSFVDNLFGGKREDREINSVNDYLALPRPTPYD